MKMADLPVKCILQVLDYIYIGGIFHRNVKKVEGMNATLFRLSGICLRQAYSHCTRVSDVLRPYFTKRM